MLLLAGSCRAADLKWKPVKPGMLCGISGMAPLGAGRYLIVHDNKGRAEAHLAVLQYKPGGAAKFNTIPWPKDGPDPVDLEGLTSAGLLASNSFVALASGGKAFHLQLDPAGRKAKLLGTFDLPSIGEGANVEGVALYPTELGPLLVWGSRGGGATAGTLAWGLLQTNDYSVAGVETAPVAVGWPDGSDRGEVRHIADLFVDKAGVVYSLAASDAGNDGPFNAALYRLGTVVSGEAKAGVSAEAEPVKLLELPGHKAEGFILIKGKSGLHLVAGTDDENKGSSVVTAPVPVAE